MWLDINWNSAKIRTTPVLFLHFLGIENFHFFPELGLDKNI